MDETTSRMAAGVREAMQAEVEGHHFYLMAARSTDDEHGRAVFEQLAEEEKQHAAFLKAQYASLLEHGRPDAEASLGAPKALEGPSPIFSDALRARIGQAHFEMTALSVGVQLELSAIHFYEAQAQAATDERVAAFFSELAKWESGHYHALLRQQEALKEDYWSGSGFAPF